MPIMQVHYPADALDEARKADLAQRLTDVLIAMEGGADTHGGRAFAWVLFTPVAAGDWWVGGQQDDAYVTPPGRFLVHVTIPEGYMNVAHKTEVHRWVNDAICAATGTPESAAPDAGGSVLVVIDEVPEGNWGCAGKTISLTSIAQTVGQRSDGERVAWSRQYFAAKRRAYETAGFPADVAP
jgi:phenylpyruvate tautomerase PptA (4-oxalocrotonate tautomerase family)